MNKSQKSDNCSSSESSSPFYCSVLKIPWYKSDLFTHVVLPAVAIVLLLYLGAQGFREYYEEIQTSTLVGRNDAGIVKDDITTEESTIASSERPDWWKPLPEVGWWDAFLLACGLPIGESMLEPGPGIGVPWKLHLARAMGLLVLPIAFFVLAFRILREDGLRLKIWWWGVSPWRRLNVLCGLGWQGHEIARLILGGARKGRQQRNRLAILEKNEANPFADTISRLGAALLVRDATVKRSHEDVSILRAERIFVVSSDDETNCRIVRQLVGIFGAKCKATDLPCLPKKRKPEGPCLEKETKLKDLCPCYIGMKRVVCYAAVRHPSTRAFLENSTRVGALTVQTFNLEQLTARHLQARRPFSPVLNGKGPEHAQVVIIGWTPMAQALLLNTLQLGHFTKGHTLEITVICPDHAAAREEFYNSYPCLKPKNEYITEDFQTHIFPTVCFYELPSSDADLLSEAFPLYQSIHPEYFVTVYICLDNGVNSRVLTKRLCPKIENDLKKIGKCKTEIQIFFYYNYPEDFLTKDDLDWSYGTKKDCKIPVESFGGLGRDFDINTITHFFLDDLAVQVSSLFDKESEEEFSKKLTRINNQEIKEKYLVCRLQRKWDLEEDWKHESNRYAADHIIVKLRCLGFNAKISDPATDNSLSHQKKRWLIDILCRPDKAKTSYSAPDGSPKQLDNSWLIDIGDADPGITAKLSKNLRNLSEAEHRRWCAERLLLGWSPFRSSPEEPRITDDEIKAWFDKNNKQLRVAQKKEKKHIDLVPFDCLPVCAELKVDEKIKDKAIVMAIPDMLEKARGMQKTADR